MTAIKVSLRLVRKCFGGGDPSQRLCGAIEDFFLTHKLGKLAFHSLYIIVALETLQNKRSESVLSGSKVERRVSE